MIIKYFRTNQSAIVLALPLVAILFWAIHFFDSGTAFNARGFLFENLNSNFQIPPIAFKIIALIFICLEAYYINRIINESEVFSKNTHVPLLMLIILGSMMSIRGGLEPMVISNFFILLAIQSTLQVYHQNSAISFTFNSGFWLGMASLFEPACFLLVIPALASVLILRAADWRELFFLLLGTILPVFFLWVICFVFDIPIRFPEDYFEIQPNHLPYESSVLFNFFLFFAGIVLLWSIYFYLNSLRGLIIRIRKMRTVLLYYSFFLAFIYIWLFFTPMLPSQNQFLLIPGVILYSYLLIHHSKPFLTDFFFYLMIGLWAVFVYNLYFS
jgi:hypothetical protein